MRLWSIHPKYLDPAGLVALWREGLLARKVLQGRTKGYRHHPQLARFQARPSPVAAIDAYLRAVWEEADARGYAFDRRKLGRQRSVSPIRVGRGQLLFELGHLTGKLRARHPERYAMIRKVRRPAPHPLFRPRPGGVEPWEKS